MTKKIKKIKKIEVNVCDCEAHMRVEWERIGKLLRPYAAQLPPARELQAILASNEVFLFVEGDSLLAMIIASPMGTKAVCAVLFPSAQGFKTAEEVEMPDQLSEAIANVLKDIHARYIKAHIELVSPLQDKLARVLEAAGFFLCGRLLYEHLFDGAWHDTLVYEAISPLVQAPKVALDIPEAVEDAGVEDEEDDEEEAKPLEIVAYNPMVRSDDLGVKEDIRIGKGEF